MENGLNSKNKKPKGSKGSFSKERIIKDSLGKSFVSKWISIPRYGCPKCKKFQDKISPFCPECGEALTFPVKVNEVGGFHQKTTQKMNPKETES